MADENFDFYDPSLGRVFEPTTVAQTQDRPAPAPTTDFVGALGTDLNRAYVTSPAQIQERARLQADVDAAAAATRDEVQRGKIAEAEANQQLIKNYGTAERGLVDQYNKKLADTPLPSFVPTPINAMDIAGVFSLMGIVGMALGGKGQMGAIGAMNSMTGMMNGWKQGRVDLYNQELKNFEKNYAVVQQQRKDIESELGRARELLKTDLAAAQQEVAVIAARHGSEVLKKMNAEVGPVRALEAFDRAAADEKKLAAQIFELRKEELKLQAQQEREDARQAAALARAELSAGARARFPTPHPDKPGKIAFFNSVTGDYERDAEGNILEAAATGRGASRNQQTQGFNQMVAIAYNEAATQIKNIGKLQFATSGPFGSVVAKTGILDAPINVLMNKLTPASVQQYNNNIQGLGLEMAKIVNGGRQVPVALQQSFQKAFEIREGDKPFTVLEKLANLRQRFDNALEVSLSMPDDFYAPETKELMRRNHDDIVKTIPFTVEDVLDYRQKSLGKKSYTFGDFMREKGPPGATPLQPPESMSAPPAPAPAAPSSQFEEGKIYVDGQGNRAVYRNGKFEEVK